MLCRQHQLLLEGRIVPQASNVSYEPCCIWRNGSDDLTSVIIRESRLNVDILAACEEI